MTARALDFARRIYRPALAEALPILGLADDPRADRQLLAIAGQEADWTHRAQRLTGGRKGPARGYWQFERPGGVAGVMRHPATARRAEQLTRARGLRTPWSQVSVWEALEHDDILATGFARLLLWTLPQPLPENSAEGWRQYREAWRPGKPRPEKWADCWGAAEAALAAMAQEAP